MSPRPRKASDAEVFAAAVRVMGRVGPADLTLTAIAAEAGVTAGALVQRFGSKLALLRALSKGGAEDSSQHRGRHPRGARLAHRRPGRLRALPGRAGAVAGGAGSQPRLPADRPDRPLFVPAAAAPGASHPRRLPRLPGRSRPDWGGGDGQRRRGAGPRRRHGRQRLVDDLGRLPGGARRRLDRTRCPGRAGTGPGRAPPASPCWPAARPGARPSASC